MAESDKDLLDIARDRFKEAVDGWSTNREAMVGDLNFLKAEGNQWPEDLKAEREEDGRPCLEINKLPAFVDQVVGDQLQNRPSIKVRPVDSDADPDTAEMLTGLIRNIENVCDAEVAYDTAFEAAASCGYGAWRIITEYVSDDVFDQDIVIKRIGNQFSVYPDHMAEEIDYSDGRFFFITTEIPRTDFEEQYPDATLSGWDLEEKHTKDWIKPETIRVAEYFYRKPKKKTIYEIAYQELDEDGNSVDRIFAVDELPPETENEPPYEILRDRPANADEIWWAKINGVEIIEGPVELPGKYFPIMLVWGKELNIEGEKVYRGIIRHAKDPQRLYNYNRSLGAETTALAPKAPFLLTPAQIEGHEGSWKLAHKKNYPYLLYNPDPTAPNALPQRQWPTQLQTGIQNEVLVADQEMHDTTGLQLASLGKAAGEKSGIAIRERRREGDVGSYAFINSLARTLKYEGKVLVDLIPKIYDTERVVRILGPDGAEDYAQINVPFADEKGEEKIHDLTVGKYDVVVTIGPSHTTQRIEAAESMIEFIKAVPETGPIMMDLLAKNLDWPGAEQIQKRLKKMLPPGIAEPEEGDEEEMPPEEMEQPPDPLMEIKVAQEEAKLVQEQAKIEGIELDNKKKELDISLKEKELAEPDYLAGGPLS